MLNQLEIKNYAIIQHVSLTFDKGLNIITGETGAGKSILLGALGLSLGDRADTKILYNQKEKCVIEAKFIIGSYHLESLFEDLDLDYDDLTIVRREINPSGKTRAFVNDTPVTLDTLRLLAEKLVNLTSQNETQQLNKESYQLELLDLVANNQKVLKEFQTHYQAYRSLKKAIQELEEEQIKLQNDYDLHQFQLNEIEAANLEGENLNTLENELSSLSNAELINTKLQAVVNLIEGEENAVSQLLNEAFYHLKEVENYNSSIAALNKRLNSSIIEIDDLKNEAAQIAEQTEYDEDRIEALNTLVNEANRLIRKHQISSIEELMHTRDNLQELTASSSSISARLKALQLEFSVTQSKLEEASKSLSKSRNTASGKVVSDIQKILTKVGMPNAIFEVKLSDKKEFTPSGKDDISFLFNANKGFAPQALNKIASGGELSRVLLSIQALLAKKRALPSLIFDEIDTGISGETAAKVAEVFRNISEDHQLIAITHLPQIAAKAEKHFFIYKNDDEEKTETKIASLNTEQHIKAIARMLSGEKISEESLSNARSLINI